MRAVILGGTGALGGATAARLAHAGWDVAVTGRDRAGMPDRLDELGVHFHALDRGDHAGVDRLIADDTDLLVDAVAYCAAHVDGIAAAARRVDSAVLISSRAVYADSRGRHVNGAEYPDFGGPVREDANTVEPATAGTDPFSREGYAPCKRAAELAALQSGAAVTILRPAKVHGRWARNPRALSIARTLLDNASGIVIEGPEAVDHLSAAANGAALIERAAAHPGARIVNAADPDTPSARQIVDLISDLLPRPVHVRWADEKDGPPPSVRAPNPWHAPHPFVLDTSAALALGYRPVGTTLELIAEELAPVTDTPAP